MTNKGRIAANGRYVWAVLCLLAFAGAAFAQNTAGWSQNRSPLPPPTGFVNDYVGAFDANAKQQLETKLKAFRDNNGVEMSVVVIDTTGGRDIFDYSLAVARGWGIGLDQGDNPAGLLLVAIKDRKYFTQVSKDLEDELPDGVTGSLQRQYLVPEFRKGNYAKGISDTIDAYIATVVAKQNGTTPPLPQAGQKSGRSDSGESLMFLCCVGIFLVVLFAIILKNSGGGPTKGDRDRWGGGGGFGGGGSSALPWIIGGILNSSGSSSSSSSDWGSSGGSDWGGFGGGGDFGGGGAGGDW